MHRAADALQWQQAPSPLPGFADAALARQGVLPCVAAAVVTACRSRPFLVTFFVRPYGVGRHLLGRFSIVGKMNEMCWPLPLCGSGAVWP
jgi:hypothetical protein